MTTVLLCIAAPSHVTESEKQRHQKLADFTAKCQLLLDESVCLAKEICTTQHSMGLFASLSSALSVFIAECDKVQSWFTEQLLSSTNLGLMPQGLLLPSTSIPQKQPISLTTSPQQRKLKKKYLPRSSRPKPSNGSATKKTTRAVRPGPLPLLPKLSDVPVHVLNNVRLKIAVPKNVPPKKPPVPLRPWPPFPPESATGSGDLNEEAVSESVVASVDKILSGRLPEELICDFCGEQLPLTKSFLVHVRTHANQMGKLPCDKCSYKARSIFTLRRHKKNDCGRLYQCAVCGTTRHEKTVLTAHIEARHGGSGLHARQCEKVYTCEICHSALRGKSHYDHHLLTHSKNVICDQCGLRTCCKTHLESHLLIHTDELPVKCDVEGCTAAFKSRRHLQAHFKRIHAKLRPHSCQHCHRRFYANQTLKQHLLRHTGERPYPCYVCGHGFSQRTNLRVHLRCVHKTKLDESKLAAQQRKGTVKSSRVVCEPPELESADRNSVPRKGRKKGSRLVPIPPVSAPGEKRNEMPASRHITAEEQSGLLPVQIDPIAAAQLSASTSSAVPENDVLTFYNNPVDADLQHEYIFNPFLG